MDARQVPQDSYKEMVNESQPGLEVAPQPMKAWGQGPSFSSPAPERTICGVRRATFFLSIALVVVIIAAAVGAGVGGSLAVQNAKSACISNTTDEPTVVTTMVTAAVVTMTVTAAAVTTRSATSTSGPLVVPTGVVKLDCPGLTDDMAISLGTDSWVFTPTCDLDYSGSDFAAVIVYSFHDCLQACAAHNYFSGEDECTAVTFRADQTKNIPTHYGNCWLKKGNPAGNFVSNAASDPVVGAKLKGSTVKSGS
ncbi:hypothetical protein E0Z10_g6165 [Xylaria hypoxylon]|uniref:Apple domain-containing protein n=1 Tax=Xylaria hypoxylon TaxID=37992 RepID=A0A4Z0YEY0_9PEZI|nr:hypothetical protein E0Z10_g6165 [Xylaria hypoxylon]